MKKIRFKLAVLSLSCAALAASLCGCNIIGNEGTDVGGPTVTPNPPVTAPVTFIGLVTDYTAQAKTFFSTKVKPQLAGEREIKAESWYLGGEGNGVTSATLSYIYVVDENIRTLEIASADFKTSVKAQDIADSKANLPEVEVIRNAVFTFDAKDNYNNQDITDALYNATAVTSPLKLYSEEEANSVDRIFNMVEMADDKITVTNLNVTKGDGSKETLLKNLANRAEYGFRETKSAAIAGVKINQSDYALENLGGGETDPDEGEKEPGKDPETPHDDTPVTNAQIIKVLNENCLEGVLKAYSKFLNTNYVKDGLWFVSKNEDRKITKAEYMFKYQQSENDAYFVMSSVEFNTPVNIKNIDNNTMQNANYQKEFRSESYNPTIQEENLDFTNKMCDKIFGNNKNATRLIMKGSVSVNSILKSEAKSFTIIEISNYQIRETSLAIKKSNNDDDYLAKLNDNSNFITINPKTYIISGEKLVIE